MALLLARRARREYIKPTSARIRRRTLRGGHGLRHYRVAMRVRDRWGPNRLGWSKPPLLVTTKDARDAPEQQFRNGNHITLGRGARASFGLATLLKEASWIILLFYPLYIIIMVLAIWINFLVLGSEVREGGWLAAMIASHIALLFAISFQCDLSEGNNVWLVLPALIYGAGTAPAHPSQWLPSWLLSPDCAAAAAVGKSCRETCSPINDLIAFVPWVISLWFIFRRRRADA